ncbi:MAG TPA: hypothetical protein VHO07_30095 [Streptosporangiaceae bacterium]|jgi:hypothetical protein|nr:hypothetical protein [Streptosporangiaceae bacterium]
MFARRILALVAVLFAVSTVGGTAAANAATVAAPTSQTVGTVSCGHGMWCR